MPASTESCSPICLDYDKENTNRVDEILAGLLRSDKMIAPKYFYDKLGSELFDRITELPEYYLTRTETAILEDNLQEIAACLGQGCKLYELGSGSSVKIRLLLESVRPKVYVPMDISREHMIDSANRLWQDYPWLKIQMTHIDYSGSWSLPDLGPGRNIAFFPGSTIGNYHPEEATVLLERLSELVGHDGGVLIGVDLKKDKRMLEAAYNDSQGITARFNLNVLRHINRSVGADFDPTAFRHQASFNDSLGRIEMHLISEKEQRVYLAGHVIDFAPGERIHSENSYKYSIGDFHELAGRAGMVVSRIWVDQEEKFSVQFLTRP